MKSHHAEDIPHTKRLALRLCGAFIVAFQLISNWSADAGTVHLSAAGPSTSLLNVLTNEPVIFIADDAGPYAVRSFNWAEGTIYLPQKGSTASVTLRFSGLYNYEDGQGHYGMIYVNIPPWCKITNPTNNAVFTAPASFDFTVEAGNTDEDKLMGVDLWLGTNYLDGSLYVPFTVPISNLGPGTYSLKADAVDYGEAVTEAVISVTVVAPTVSLSNPRTSAGQLVFNVNGVATGGSIVLERRISFNSQAPWVPIQTNVGAAISLSLTTPLSSGAAFFRAKQLP